MQTSETLWMTPTLVVASTGFALALYIWTAAPGLTWAHQAADGAELLAAAVTNGVPHPPGYPLYMLLLQGWLGLGQWLAPTASIARLGNLLSALCAALSAGVTAAVAYHLLPARPLRWGWALIAAGAWAVSPLLWSQAIVTEVYALHALLVALLGWALFNRGGRAICVIPVVACGIAHHLTMVLLLPATLYYLWHVGGRSQTAWWRSLGMITAGVILGACFYLRTPLAAAGGGNPPPINWGYADNWRGFWWLVSGAAYRGYLFAGERGDLFGRLTGWAFVVTNQFTPMGLALSLVGLSYWDRLQGALRTWSLLWIGPVSLYAVSYFTRDSEIYLLPVVWVMALWLALGTAEASVWVQQRWPLTWLTRGVAAALTLGMLTLMVVRLSDISLRHDHAAQTFVDQAATVLEPDSILITLADAETFMLWYGAWGSGELLQAAPGLVLINYSLYQFDWYRRLLRAQYPTLVGDEPSVEAILAANGHARPVFFSEMLSYIPPERLQPVGPLWRYLP